ncbi:MAG: hypothetical protein JWM59_4064 [Verrucomicrobiales bacterium]|nr:hypothetical protein [Verrucomicrobiales bacterium]
MDRDGDSLGKIRGLSLTTIKARFAKFIGRGPKQKFHRVRLLHLRRNTGEPLGEIARPMKFGSAHELSRFFLTETGQRPGEFRTAGSVSTGTLTDTLPNGTL